MAAADRPRSVAADDRTGAHRLVADGALPRSPRSARQRIDARVLRDPHRLSAVDRPRMGAPPPCTESVYAPGGGVSGSARHARTLLGLAAPHRPCGSLVVSLRCWLLRLRSSAGHARGGSVNAIEVRD